MSKKYVTLATCLVLMIGGVFFWYGITAPFKAASRNLSAINSLTAGETTETELLSRSEFRKIERKCFQESCFYHMEAENTLLNRLHLAPRTFMGTNVMVRERRCGRGLSIYGQTRPAGNFPQPGADHTTRLPRNALCETTDTAQQNFSRHPDPF
jgi:hypothetical protein